MVKGLRPVLGLQIKESKSIIHFPSQKIVIQVLTSFNPLKIVGIESFKFFFHRGFYYSHPTCFNPLTPVPAITSHAKTNPKLPVLSACNLKSLLSNILNEHFYFSDYGFKGFSLLHSHMEWLSNTYPVSYGKKPHYACIWMLENYADLYHAILSDALLLQYRFTYLSFFYKVQESPRSCHKQVTPFFNML